MKFKYVILKCTCFCGSTSKEIDLRIIYEKLKYWFCSLTSKEIESFHTLTIACWNIILMLHIIATRKFIKFTCVIGRLSTQVYGNLWHCYQPGIDIFGFTFKFYLHIGHSTTIWPKDATNKFYLSMFKSLIVIKLLYFNEESTNDFYFNTVLSEFN